MGTPLYMSPEVLRGDGYGWKSDVWSLGCMLYELAMLRSPFKGEGLNLYSLFKKITNVRAQKKRSQRHMHTKCVYMAERRRGQIEKKRWTHRERGRATCRQEGERGEAPVGHKSVSVILPMGERMVGATVTLTKWASPPGWAKTNRCQSVDKLLTRSPLIWANKNKTHKKIDKSRTRVCTRSRPCPHRLRPPLPSVY